MVNLVQSLEPRYNTAASHRGMPETSFKKKEKKKKAAVKEEDKILPNDVFSKMKYNIKKTKDIALTHFPRGLYGAPDYTFFEYLQTAKFPYYVGGPILAALFYAGVKYDNLLSGNSAKKVAKHMALGVGLYYAAAALAKGIINTTVQLTRGMDLNHPYQRVISKTPGYSGIFKKGFEIQKVYGSNEFTRWDVLYKKEGKTLAEINERYTELAKKFKIKAETEDPDGTLKHLIKKTIIMSKAWQYALTALFVPIFLGMGEHAGLFLYDNLLSGTLLQSASWVLLPLGLTNISSALLNSLGYESKSFINFLVGAVAMFIALWTLPSLVGINAIIWAMGINYTITAILNIYLLKRKTKANFVVFKPLLKIILLTIPVSALTAFVVSLCDYIFPLFITLVIGGVTSVTSFVLLAGVVNLVDIKAFVVSAKARLKPNKRKIKVS